MLPSICPVLISGIGPGLVAVVWFFDRRPY
jgi:hypothetical protein